jgi:hypothetical protein
MALNWNLADIKDSDSVCWIEATRDDPNHGIEAGKSYMNPVTNALIWATIAVDLGEITETNAAEFFARLRFTEQIDGPFLIRAEVDGVRPEGAAAYITAEEVWAHVGLCCNVSPKTRAQWMKRWNRDIDSLANKARRERVDPTCGDCGAPTAPLNDCHC